MARTRDLYRGWLVPRCLEDAKSTDRHSMLSIFVRAEYPHMWPRLYINPSVLPSFQVEGRRPEPDRDKYRRELELIQATTRQSNRNNPLTNIFPQLKR